MGMRGGEEKEAKLEFTERGTRGEGSEIQSKSELRTNKENV